MTEDTALKTERRVIDRAKGARNRLSARPQRPEGPPGEGWVWGKHAARAAIQNPRRTIFEVLVTRNSLADMPEGAPNFRLVEPKVIDAVLPPSAVHQGLAVRCTPPEPVEVEELAVRDGVIIVFDQVTDPQNVGAVLRSGVAFGAVGAILQDRKAPPLLGACAKAAVGAAERLDQARVVNISRALGTLREAGWWVVGLSGEGERTLDDAMALAPGFTAGRIVLVLGAEDKGLRPSVAEACDVLGRIPITADVESLNASAAAAVALYAAARARAAVRGAAQPSEGEPAAAPVAVNAPARVFTFPRPAEDDEDDAALRAEGYAPIRVDGVTLAGVSEPELERALVRAAADLGNPDRAAEVRAAMADNLAAVDAALAGATVEGDAPQAVIDLLAAAFVRFGITDADALPFARVTWTRAPEPAPQVERLPTPA